jgi:CcmD family protein
MQGATFLVLAYAVAWIGLLAYLGWIALRVRGVRTELETVRALVETHGGSEEAGHAQD